MPIVGCGGGSGPNPAIKSGMLFGFNDDPVVRSYQLQAKLAMPVRRIAIPWQQVEPGRGRWDWGRYDLDYRAMLRNGLRPLILVAGGPCWAGERGTPCVNGATVPGVPFLADWAEYVRQVVRRYPRAVGVEVWNEPNSIRQFPPRPDPARYSQLLAAAYSAVKSIDPRMPVVSGGLLPTDRTTSVAIADDQFLAAIYRLGAARFMDAIGAHPYPIAFAPGGSSHYDVGATEEDLDRLRAVRDAARDSSTPIWVTEMGVSTASGPGFPAGVDPSTQADDLVDLAHEVGHDPDVPLALIHRLVDVPSASVQAGFGVFQANGAPKPAACSLSGDLGGSLTC
jgi:polysaccharide biosynthesis protein PslG